MALDVISTAVSGIAGLALLRLLWDYGRPPTLLACAVPALLVALAVNGMYGANALRLAPSGMPAVGRVARSYPLAALMVLVVLLYGVPGHGARALSLTTAALAPALLFIPATRSLVTRMGPRWTMLGRRQRVLIVGSGEAADAVASRLRRHGGIAVIGMVDDEPLPGFHVMGRVSDIAHLCYDHGIDRIIVAVPRSPWLAVSEALQPLIGSVEVAVVPSLYELMTWRSGSHDLSGIPLVTLKGAQRSVGAKVAKRVVDLVGGGLTLVLTSPILLLAVAAIRIESKGPLFFRQERAGRDGQPFSIWKFRTMCVGAEDQRASLRESSDAVGLFKLRHDPRVTRVGALLRRFSIDELPQLFNVLAGQMSLVGPRPYPMDEAEALRVGPAASRFEMLPGMTGLWQVSGRSDLTWDDLCRLDAIYVRSWSLLWDLRILIQTPAAVLRSQGAY